MVGVGAFLGDVEARAESVFRHIDYIAALVGPEHVGIGTDYVRDMTSIWEAIRASKEVAWPDPTGTQLYAGVCFRPEQLTELIDIMLIHGYSHGGNKGNFGCQFPADLCDCRRPIDPESGELLKSKFSQNCVVFHPAVC